jgi:hypothetical protein
MTQDQLVSILFSCLGFLMTGFAGWFVLEFREMRKGVSELNIRIATIIEKIEHHEERLETLELHLRHEQG